ncbi:MAG: hypothetical protein AAF936_10520 [Pseudomonadota bacterium]
MKGASVLMLSASMLAMLMVKPVDASILSEDPPKDETCDARASAVLQSAARNGNTDAQIALAGTYLNSACGPQDIISAVALLRSAADAGEISAAVALGEIYFSGSVVTRNLSLAKKYLQIAAEANDIGAQHRLGLLLLLDASDSLQRLEGLYWLGSAASLGDGFSAASIAMIHERGMYGVRSDPCWSLDWYAAAESLGFNDLSGHHAAQKAVWDEVCY